MTEAHLAECLQRLEETRKTLDQIGTDLRGAQEFRDAVFDLLEGTPFGAQADSTYDGLYGRLRAAVGAASGPPAIVAVPYVIKDLAFVVAQLRHAYQQIHDGRVSRRGMKLFADGLIAPQIRRLEKVLMQGAEGAPPALYQEPEKPTTIQELWDLEEKHPPFVGSTGRRHRPEVASPAPPAEQDIQAPFCPFCDEAGLMAWSSDDGTKGVSCSYCEQSFELRQIPSTSPAPAPPAETPKEAHLMDVYAALGVPWGDDPFAEIARLQARHAELEIERVARYEEEIASLRSRLAEAASPLPPVPVEACPACGAEPGCNIDCMWCKWIAAVRAASPLPRPKLEEFLHETPGLSGADNTVRDPLCPPEHDRRDGLRDIESSRTEIAPLPRGQDIRALIAEWRSSANFIADVLVPTPEGAQDEFRLRNCADALEKLLPAPPQDERTKP